MLESSSIETKPSIKSWIDVPCDSDFSIRNFPFGVFSVLPEKPRPRCCTVIGNLVVDLSVLAEAGLFDGSSGDTTGHHNSAPHLFYQSTLNKFLACERPVWESVRNKLVDLFDAHGDDALRTNLPLQKASLHNMDLVTLHLPVAIGDYTDFYSSREHATNVGTMFRGKDQALQPNWLHLPVGYHGRSSTVFVSGTPVHRPCGQLQKDPNDSKQGSTFGPCRMMDFELEMSFFVGGPPNVPGQRLDVSSAYKRIFGFCLTNDWSARDIQKWEYVPLGPFTSKNFATTISPWIVTTMALEEFRCDTSAVDQTDPMPLPYLQDPNYGSFDVKLEVQIQDESMQEPATVCRSNLRNMYWDAAQQLVHHSVTGCVMEPGDMLASGTISGSTDISFGSMLELCWKGTRQVPLGSSGNERRFLQDNDTVIMKGWTEKKGYGRVGFGACAGKILPVVRHQGDDKDEVSFVNVPTSVVSVGRDDQHRYRDFKLYAFWKSSSSWRVRIALHAKSIKYRVVSVNLKEEEHMLSDHVERNPMAQVPVLEFTDSLTSHQVRLSQSVAIIDFLEEAFPSRRPLLPVDPLDKASARQMVEVINSGIQPMQNLFLLRRLEQQSEGKIDAKEFAAKAIESGFAALEQMVVERRNHLRGTAGPFCMGTFWPSIVDMYLVPQMYNARLFGANVEEVCPSLVAIDSLCVHHSWFMPAHADLQPDAGT